MSKKWIYVNTREQQLYLFDRDELLARYPVSTAKNGLGEIEGSEKTPRGWHCIEKKIGGEEPLYTVFKGRVPTGEIYSAALAQQYPTRDWILTRILWLSGLEEGKNKGGNVDTFARYIYIHGAPDTSSFDTPSSHGCVRMRNQDLIALFESVDEKTPVFIGDEPAPNPLEYL